MSDSITKKEEKQDEPVVATTKDSTHPSIDYYEHREYGPTITPEKIVDWFVGFVTINPILVIVYSIVLYLSDRQPSWTPRDEVLQSHVIGSIVGIAAVEIAGYFYVCLRTRLDSRWSRENARPAKWFLTLEEVFATATGQSLMSYLIIDLAIATYYIPEFFLPFLLGAPFFTALLYWITPMTEGWFVAPPRAAPVPEPPKPAPVPVAPPPVPEPPPIPDGFLGHVIWPAWSSEPRGAPVCISPLERARHLYLLGPTGAGKTNVILNLIEHDLRHDRSICVMDHDGRLADRVLKLMTDPDHYDTWAERLLLVDLRDPSWVVGYNPLTLPGEPYQAAQAILSMLKPFSDYWGPQFEETLEYCLRALAESKHTLLEMEPLLTNPAFRSVVLREVSDGDTRSFFENRYNQLSRSEQEIRAAPVLSRIRKLLRVPQLRMMFGQRFGIDLEAFINQPAPVAIVIALGAQLLKQDASMAGGLLADALISAISARKRQQKYPQIHIYLDEFPDLIRETLQTSVFKSLLSQGRHYRAGLCLGHQNMTQLPTEILDLIRNNCYTQVYFQAGVDDAPVLARKFLRNDMTDAEMRIEMRRVLLSQPVGNVILYRRGQETIQLAVPKYLTPKTPAAAVATLKQTSRDRHARERQELEVEFEARAAEQADPHHQRSLPALPSPAARALPQGVSNAAPRASIAPKAAAPRSGSKTGVVAISSAKTVTFQPEGFPANTALSNPPTLSAHPDAAPKRPGAQPTEPTKSDSAAKYQSDDRVPGAPADSGEPDVRQNIKNAETQTSDTVALTPSRRSSGRSRF